MKKSTPSNTPTANKSEERECESCHGRPAEESRSPATALKLQAASEVRKEVVKPTQDTSLATLIYQRWCSLRAFP